MVVFPLSFIFISEMFFKDDRFLKECYSRRNEGKGVNLHMGKSVVIAEKPSVARDIARVLNCNKKGQGFLEGNQYIVTWALGHLVTLAEPEQYDKKYKTWNLNDLPMLPQDLKLMVIKQTSR